MSGPCVEQQLCSLLGPSFLSHNYTLTPTQLKRALTYIGPNHRLRRVVRDMITGRVQVRVGVIGTSVSWGTGVSRRGMTDWFSEAGQMLQRLFPKAQLKMHNGCFPGTPSSFANMCHSKMVQPDVDLLFVEYITNDFMLSSHINNFRMQAYERLMRKLLKQDQHPAVVLVQLLTWGQSFPASSKDKQGFHESAEDQYGSIAQYYGIPWLSYRNAVWIDAEFSSPWIPSGWKQLTDDALHPNDLGHRVILDMIVWLIKQTAVDLLLQPFSRIDSWYLKQMLPPPMQKGNYEEPIEMCLMDEELRSIVREEKSTGWAFVNEGTAEKPKTGFVSDQASPGSKLVIELSPYNITARNESMGSDDGDHLVSLLVSYLQSYTGMGRAKIACDNGCQCKEATNFSAGRGNKFKITAVMMTRQSALGFFWPEEPAQFMAQDIFTGEFGKEELEMSERLEDRTREGMT